VSELAPPKVRVEIYSEPALFDDHFCRNWTVISGSIVLDGDNVRVSSSASNQGIIERTFSSALDSNVYTKIAARISQMFVGTWHIIMFDNNSATWKDVLSGTDAGFFEATLPTGCSFTQIRLNMPDLNSYVLFDYVAISKQPVFLPVPDNVIERLSIISGVLANGISSASLCIPNFGGENNNKVKEHDVIIIWVARDSAYLGLYTYKRFGGRISKLTNRGEEYGKFYIDLETLGHAYELVKPPNLLCKVYNSVNGRTIIEEAVDACAYIAKHPTASSWFDNAGASGSTDDRINSTHNIEPEDVRPLNIIQEILEKASNPAGTKGFDVCDIPSGVLKGHLRNSLDFTSSVSVTPESYRRIKDPHRIGNQIIVYGQKGKKNPSTQDAWTDSLTNWGAYDGELSLSSERKAGSYSIQCYDALGGVDFKRTLTAFGGGSGKGRFKTLSFWAWQNTNIDFKVYLLCPDLSNRVEKTVYGAAADNRWEKYTVDIKDFTTVGSPDLKNIQGIGFSSASANTFRVDDIQFSNCRFSGSAEDPTSKSKYGTRMPEPVVDESLTSDAECTAKAESLIILQKDPVVSMENVLTDGNHLLYAGDRQRVIVPNDGIDEYFRIVKIEDVIGPDAWDAILTLSNEPQTIDYVFQLLEQARKMLERRS